MSQQDLPKVTVHETGHLLLGDRPLYLCLVHQGCEVPPFYIRNGENEEWGDQADWVSQWEPVMFQLESDDPDIQNLLELTLAPRPYDKNEEKTNQATFDDYQLYLYTKDTNPAEPKGEMPSFWKRIIPGEVDKREDCDVPEPPNARGP